VRRRPCETRGLVGFLLIASAAAAAFLFAAALRLGSLVSTLLAAYLAYVAITAAVTLALSPIRWVTQGGLAVAQTIVLVAAVAAWWARGRPALPLAEGRAAAREVLTDPVSAVFLAFVLVLLGYELVLALSVPQNNGDALGYHLPRAAAWAEHHGIYWIPNAPTVRMNAFQPLAEQQILFSLVATAGGRLVAMPQYLAELAMLVAVYGASRRLGFAVRPAAGAASLVATFSLVALEATTAQNDLVAASFPVVAACLLLSRGTGWVEPLLGGASAGMGLGAKLTAGLVLPVLAWLALARGRRVTAAAAVGGVVGLLAIGMWGYVLNWHSTGHLLGSDTGQVLNRASPSYPDSLGNAFYLIYGTMDASILSSRLIHALALVGLVAGIAVAAWALYRRRGVGRALGNGAMVALPLLAPLLVIGAGGVISWVSGKWGFPIRQPGGLVDQLFETLNKEYTRMSHHSFSAFGPIGIVTLVAAIVLTVYDSVARRLDMRRLALASALPLFLVLVALTTFWNPFLVRFFVVPAVLTAPLAGRLLGNRMTYAAYAVAASLAIGLTITHDQTKPLESAYGYGYAWNLDQQQALSENSRPEVAESLDAIDKALPADACVGAVLDVWEPSYLLYGPHLERHVVYLPVDGAASRAAADRLPYAVITTGDNGWAVDGFEQAGWRVEQLPGIWRLAVAPYASKVHDSCPS